MPLQPIVSGAAFDDAELVRGIARHEDAAFEIVMRRHDGLDGPGILRLLADNFISIAGLTPVEER